MADFVFGGGIVLLVLLGPWVLVWWVNSRSKRERAEDQEQWRELTSRIYALEQTVRKFQAQRPGPATEEATPKAAESWVAASYTPPPVSPDVVSPPPSSPITKPNAEPIAEPSPSVGVAESWVTQKTVGPQGQNCHPPPIERFRLLLRQRHHRLRQVSPHGR